jgi:hypothetical protein
METSCGRRVSRKSTATSTTTAPMTSAHSIGVPTESMVSAPEPDARFGSPSAGREAVTDKGSPQVVVVA